MKEMIEPIGNLRPTATPSPYGLTSGFFQNANHCDISRQIKREYNDSKQLYSAIIIITHEFYIHISKIWPPHKYATIPYYDINLQNSTIILTDDMTYSGIYENTTYN